MSLGDSDLRKPNRRELCSPGSAVLILPKKKGVSEKWLDGKRLLSSLPEARLTDCFRRDASRQRAILTIWKKRGGACWKGTLPRKQSKSVSRGDCLLEEGLKISP